MGIGLKIEGAVSLLQRDILNGTHPPGKSLRLSHLSARYGLGTAPIRDALMRLSDMQLVVASDKRGWQVAPVSLSDFNDLLHARMTIELVLLDEAIETGTKEWEANLVAAHYRLTQAVRPLGAADTLAYRQTWIAVHDSFHACLLAGARAVYLKLLHAQVQCQLQRHHQAVMSQLSSVTETQEPLLIHAFSIPRHTELMVAALNRDKAAAAIALKNHNELTTAFFQRFLGKSHPAA